jgi:hypothetical protein
VVGSDGLLSFWGSPQSSLIAPKPQGGSPTLGAGQVLVKQRRRKVATRREAAWQQSAWLLRVATSGEPPPSSHRNRTQEVAGSSPASSIRIQAGFGASPQHRKAVWRVMTGACGSQSSPPSAARASSNAARCARTSRSRFSNARNWPAQGRARRPSRLRTFGPCLPSRSSNLRGERWPSSSALGIYARGVI